MGNFAKFFVCLLVSASFFLVLYFRFLNEYITFDKTKEACEANNSTTTTPTPAPTKGSGESSDYISKLDSNSCTIWYSQYGLCLKGVKDNKGTCQQKNMLIPAGLIFGGLFFALFAIMSLLF
jgi:hypothetical protein